MQKIFKNDKTRDLTIMIISLALIAFSAIVIGLSFSHFNSATKTNQDEQLKTVETSVDYNIGDAMDRFDKQMDYAMSSSRLTRAAGTYKDSGQSEALEDALKNSSLGTLGNYEAIFVTEGKKTVATSSDYETYTVGKEVGEDLFECKDSAGEEYIAFKRDLASGLNCYGVMSIEKMFKSVLLRVNAESQSVILLYVSGNTLYYETEEGIKSCNAAVLSDVEDIDVSEAGLLCRSQKENVVKTGEYDMSKGSKGKAAMRAVAVPADKTENGAFAISVTTDFSATASLLKSTITKVVLFFILAMIGLIILVLFLIRMRREQNQADIELERLKEKNQQMEELNEKLRELEHHQRLETIGTMTSGIAHEFNNLLAPIMGYSIMTLEKLDPNDEVLYDGVLEIYNASKKAKDIISRLSDLARKNTEKVFVKIPPDVLVERTINVTAPSLPMNVDLRRDFKCEGKYINGNETQLSQLLMNLIINAFQALAEEGGTVTVATEAKDGEIIFTVSDDGPGIKDEIKESIFEPFFTTKEAGAGTGLGLAIVLQAAEDHGGRVELESEEGNGCCFRIHIPEYVPEEED